MTVDDFAARLMRLLDHPLSQRSLNRQHLGALGTRVDIEVTPGWIAVVERLYRELSILPESQWLVISRIKEKYASLVIDYDADHDSRAACLIETASAICDHRCQICGARGRLQDDGFWLRRLCQTHWLDVNAPGVGEPWPPIQVLVHLRGGAILSFGQIHGFEDQPLRPWRANSRVSLNRQLDIRDAIACALDPAETARQLDATIFHGEAIRRQFELADARPLLTQAATGFGMASDHLAALIDEMLTAQKWHRAAWTLSALLRGDYDEDVG